VPTPVLVLLLAAAAVVAAVAAMRVRLAGRRGPHDRAGRRRRARTLALVAVPPTVLAVAVLAGVATGRIEAPARPDPPPGSAWCEEGTAAAERTEAMFAAITSGDRTDIGYSAERWLTIDVGALRAAAATPDETKVAARFDEAIGTFTGEIDPRSLEKAEVTMEMASAFFEMLAAGRELATTLDGCPAP